MARLRLQHALLVAAAAVPAAAQEPARVSTGEAWQLIQPVQSSLVFARDGSIIGEICRSVPIPAPHRECRSSVALASLPPHVPNAFIAVEDQRFYRHDGVDYVGLAGVAKDVITAQGARGGSTITQQLVGIMHPDIIDRSDRSIGRKLREQSAAREMEKRYSKQAILESYLNWVDLGRGWFGVEMAARHYFGKPASRLTLAEAASLAAIPKAPPSYEPIGRASANLTRRNVILTMMAEQGLVSRELAEKAKLEKVVTAPHAGMAAPSNYFVDAVRKEAEKAGIPVINGGYRIYTTLDPALQNAAVAALIAGTTEVEKTKGYRHLTMANRGTRTDYLQGGVIAMDPYTGDIRALVGGRNHALAPFNRVTSALRQPGSSIKPIVYARALEMGYPITAIVPDTSLEIPLITGDVYTPGNADGEFLGAITLREALVKSRNPVAVQLGMIAGMDSISALAERMGFTNRMDPVPASAIGASVVKPIDLVAAYSAFVNNGQVVQPRLITRIENARGQSVHARPPSTPQPVIDPRAAFIIRDVLREGVERGTGFEARKRVPYSVPMAGKTGTTNDNVDVWFTGMTPDLVAAVWLGFDKPKTIITGGYGGTLAAPIWGNMMAKYYAGRRAGEWPTAPAGLVFAEVDRATGAMANAQTPAERRAVEYFMPGTEPLGLRGNPWLVPRWGPIW